VSDTMFCSVVCIFTPSHCCDVRCDVLFCIRHHNSVKVWRYKWQNRTSYQTPQQCEGVKIQTTEQNIVSDTTTVWRCEDTKERTEHRIRHHNSLFCRLYLRTFTLLWCPIWCSVLSFVSSHLHIVVMFDMMFCSVVTTEQNIVSDITTVWGCEDTNDRTEHRIRHHNSVKVWRYKRQNRTSYQTSQIRCSVLSFVSSYLHTVVMSDTMFCSVVCISSHLHTVVVSDTMFCSVVCIFTPSHCCDVRYDVLFCNSVKVWRYKWQNRTSHRTSQQCEGVKIQKTEQNIVSDITTVWRCEDLHIVVMSYTMFSSVVCIFTPSHNCDVRYDVLFCRLYLHTFTLLWCLIRCSVHRIGHHNSVKVWRYKRQNRTSYRTSQ
jgi:hypothetical protein